jgi:UDP-glucose 4-epimerase
MRLAGFLVGKSSTVNRLLDSLVVDISKIRNELNWQPSCTMKEGLTATAHWFLKGLT